MGWEFRKYSNGHVSVVVACAVALQNHQKSQLGLKSYMSRKGYFQGFTGNSYAANDQKT